MYWSAVMMLVAMIDETRDATSAPLDFAFSMMGVIRRSRTPAFSTTPPKASAVIMSQIVFSMLSMPPREASMSSDAIPELDLYPLASASQTPFSSATTRGSSPPGSAKAVTRPGSRIAASSPPAMAPRKIDVNGVTLKAASPTTTTSGRNSQSEMWNDALIPSILAEASKSPGWPSMKKIASEIATATDDVNSVSRRCG